MILVHKIHLKTNNSQREYLRGCSGANRFTWNFIVDKFKNNKDKTFNVLELKKEFNKIKKEKYEFLYDYPKDCNQQAFLDFKKLLSRFFKKEAGFPKFKSRHTSKKSFYLSNDQCRIKDEFFIFKGFKSKLSESIRFEGKIMGVRIVEEVDDKWVVCFFIETENYKRNRVSNNEIGLDLGLKNILHASNNETFNYPEKIKRISKRIKRYQRKISKRKKNSNNRNKARKKYRKLWYKIKNIRKDFTDKISTKINKENQFIVLEDLNVKGMIRNRSLSHSIGNACWGEIKLKIVYKSKLYENEIIFADRFYPSSKLCSNCGFKKEDLKLSDRIYNCNSCGMKMDRDLNASFNLKNLIPKARGKFKPADHSKSGRKQEIVLENN